MNLRAILRGDLSGVIRSFYGAPANLQWQVFNTPDALEDTKQIPIELRYALALHPSRRNLLSALLNQGHGLALGKQSAIPGHVTDAVHHICAAHHGALYPWLEDLTLKQANPRWSESDHIEAQDMGLDLNQLTKLITDHVNHGVQLKLIQCPESSLDPNAHSAIRSIETDIRQIHALETTHRLACEHLSRTRDFNYLFLLSLVLFAPIVHVLEILYLGLGKFLSLLLPALFHESLQQTRSYALGAASWQVFGCIKAKLPELAVLLISAAAVNLLLSANLPILAGLSFAIAACSVLFGKEFRRLKKAKQVHRALSQTGKVQTSSKTAWLKLYYGPLWWIHGASIAIAILASVMVFTYLSPVLGNGWVLALLAISPYLAFEALLIIWRQSLNLRFSSRVKKLLNSAIIT
ncbi:hypothetical protein GF391_03705 [Candidatus Uhrbacteria bacterium]|nr:hypothetical protein [Candidatus Uhrbacteria bacterium]